MRALKQLVVSTDLLCYNAWASLVINCRYTTLLNWSSAIRRQTILSQKVFFLNSNVNSYGYP